MKYVKAKKIETEYTIIEFRYENMFYYGCSNGYFYYGINTGLLPIKEIIAKQPKEIEAEEAFYQDIKEILKSSDIEKQINTFILDDIQKKYPINEELKLTKRAITNPLDEEYIAMQNYIQNVKDTWSIQKRNMGLIQ